RAVAARARARDDQAPPRARETDAAVDPRRPPDGAGEPRLCRPRTGVTGESRALATNPDPHARRERVPQPLRLAEHLPLSLRAPLRHLCGRPRVPGLLPPGGIRYRHVRRQLQLARTDLVPDECPDPAGAAPVLPVLRRWI